MSDKKISELTASTTPLAGTEVLPIVQSGATKKVSVADLTAGRTVNASRVVVGNVDSTVGAIDISAASAGNTVRQVMLSNSPGLNSGVRLDLMTSGNTARVAYIKALNPAIAGSGGPTELYFATNNDFANSVEQMKIGKTGDITALTGNLVIGTSGKGIEASTGYVNASAYKLAAAGIITESGTSRTLSDADNGKVIYCTSGSAVTISCPDGLDVGFSATIIQAGAGKVTLAASGTATLNSYSGLLSTMGQWAAVSVISPTADVFVASGNLGV